MAKPQNRRSMSPREPKEFEEEVLQIDRVTRVVAGGRRLRFRATVVIGNRKGKVGIGLGKAGEVAIAIQKAISKAKKNLITVPTYKNTIPHPVDQKFKSAKVMMKPASEGTGIIAGGAIRKIIDLAGVKNILSKRFGTTNKIANAKATIMALQKLKQPRISAADKAKEAAEAADRSAVKTVTMTKAAVDAGAVPNEGMKA